MKLFLAIAAIMAAAIGLSPNHPPPGVVIHPKPIIMTPSTTPTMPPKELPLLPPRKIVVTNPKWTGILV